MIDLYQQRRPHGTPGFIPKRFDRDLYDRCTEERRAGGISAMASSVAGSSSASALATPWSFAACRAFFDAAQTQTYGAALVAAGGGTPPAATLSGTQSVFSPIDIKIVCTTGGTTGSGGAGLCSISLDGGATTVATGVAMTNAVALTGAATGLSVSFAAGTATTAHSWTGWTNTQASLKTGTDVITSFGSPKLKVGASGILGRAAWLADGTATRLNNTSVVLPTPGTTPYFIYGVAQVTAAGAGFGCMFGKASGGSFAPPTFVASTATMVTANNGGNGSNSGMVIGTPKRFVVYFAGGTGTDSVQWGSTIVSGLTLGNSGGSTGIEFLSCSGAANTFFNGLLANGGVFIGAPSAGGLQTALDAWLVASSGGAGFTGGSALTA